jgi:hypothetical protein
MQQRVWVSRNGTTRFIGIMVNNCADRGGGALEILPCFTYL